MIHSILTRPGTKTLCLAVALALIVLPGLRRAGSEAKAASMARAMDAEAVRVRNSSAFAKILGELRLGAADLMLVKTERYIHGGVGYAAHADAHEAESGKLGEETVHDDDHHDPADEHEHGEQLDAATTLAELNNRGAVIEEDNGHRHEVVSTAIRTRENDFRGFLGNLEREIKPWHDPKEPHVLTSGAELVPWYRLMTISNPRFVRAYRLGAMWLAFEGATEEALDFIAEGIANNEDNPELFQLYLSKTSLLNREALAGDEARFEEALKSARRGLEAGVDVRPRGGETGKIKKGLLWSEDHEEDFVFLARLAPMLLERLGRFDEALRASRRGSELAPDDVILRRLAARVEAGESPYQLDAP